VKPKFGRKDRKAGLEKELLSKVTSLDRAILDRASRPRGEDLIGLVSACKPYKNKHGTNEFASSPVVRGAIIKLRNLGLLDVK
jgi:hypothetical protein